MAKKAGRPKTSEREDTSVKLDKRLVGQAKVVAAFRGVSVAELLSELVREPMAKAYAAMVRALDSKGN